MVARRCYCLAQGERLRGGVETKNSQKENQMKCITLFIVVMSFVSLALAQEESPSPSAEQPASATVQESPASTVTAAPAASATPAVATSPAKKESPTAAAPKKTTAAAPATSGKKMGVEGAIKDNENRWEASYAAHDISVPQSLVANDFAGVYWDGRVFSKSNIVGEMKKDKDTYKSAVNEKMAVHSYGPGVAVVVGTTHEKGTGKDGKAFDRTFRFTDTWVERNGTWQCVASQVMKIKG
jgi:hypothetical protein